LPPPPVDVDPEFVTPQENESTSISSLCLESTDSPLMSPILAKISVAIGAPSPCGYAHDSRDWRQPEPSHKALFSACYSDRRDTRTVQCRRLWRHVVGAGSHDFEMLEFGSTCPQRVVVRLAPRSPTGCGLHALPSNRPPA